MAEVRNVEAVTNVSELKRASVNVNASSTDATLVAAVSGKIIRVISAFCVAGGTATTATFQSNTTAISPLIANGANGGLLLPENKLGWFETTAGEALKVTTGTGSSTGFQIVYCEVL